MKITYEFITGEKVSVEVDEEWGRITTDLDRQEYNNDHAETRRHVTLDSRKEEGEWLSTTQEDPAQHVDLLAALAILERAKKDLTQKQLDIFLAITIGGHTITSVSEAMGVSRQTVHEQYKRAIKKIKLIAQKNQ